MFLKSLTIESEGHIVRDIVFHKGINFIVDETKLSETEETQTGNNVGKTTVLRLINFCLGGSDKNIYQSKEFKNNINEEVKNFLIDKQVVITLKLIDELNDPCSRQIEIRRNFLSKSRKLIEIDGQSVKLKDFDTTLKKLVFGYEDEKPTFKQLKAKNIRDEAERLENTVRVLGNFGKAEEYEALYLFWLGVPYPDAEKKRRLIEERNFENKLYTRLRKENSESKISQFIAIVEHDIEALEHKKKSCNINENYEADLNTLNGIRAKLNSLNNEQSQLNLRKELIEESRKELENNLANDEVSLLPELYAQANVLLPNIQKTYEETVAFHNQMILEKISFVTEELPNIQEQLIKINTEIQFNLSEEVVYADKLRKADIHKELEEIIKELNAKYERKGTLEEKLSQLQDSKAKLDDIDSDLKLIDESIGGLDGLIQKRVASFNTYFSDISNKLYGEQFVMSATFEQKSNSSQYFYKLYIDSLNGQTGTGKKKGEIAAFDLAYIRFADEQQIKSLHFILHDQMEVVDDNQINGLVREVINTNCQLVVPILRDKLPSKLHKPEYQVLSLSQNNKLFMI
ncbi:DUF2326 domain-containing protein [Thalassotalea profundi]|uniref:DUF2326 domain-containing protein n=1 Tax=Thalassotalea profundi TaxID=2036687 RepID=A0ABQ3IJ16_9GAMM|nr:DUF2326 domain-containing protein [Thalassotalea profundi]GHE80133.1 hypothetical protein GCM10011501_04950 [Thalassotalea profundi]